MAPLSGGTLRGGNVITFTDGFWQTHESQLGHPLDFSLFFFDFRHAKAARPQFTAVLGGDGLGGIGCLGRCFRSDPLEKPTPPPAGGGLMLHGSPPALGDNVGPKGGRPNAAGYTSLSPAASRHTHHKNQDHQLLKDSD